MNPNVRIAGVTLLGHQFDLRAVHVNFVVDGIRVPALSLVRNIPPGHHDVYFIVQESDLGTEMKTEFHVFWDILPYRFVNSYVSEELPASILMV